MIVQMGFILFEGRSMKSGKMCNACFRQWFPFHFTVDSREYCCTEQYMMMQKALIFVDQITCESIMAMDPAGEIKALGREMKHFARNYGMSASPNPSQSQGPLKLERRKPAECCPDGGSGHFGKGRPQRHGIKKGCISDSIIQSSYDLYRLLEYRTYSVFTPCGAVTPWLPASKQHTESPR